MAQLTEAELAQEIWMFMKDITYSMAEQMARAECNARTTEQEGN